MREWDANRLARAAAARLVYRPNADDAPPGGARDIAASGPLRVSIDSRAIAPGDLFVGLRGERSDGGEYAAQALQAGAWGVLVAPEHALAVAAMAEAAMTGVGYHGVVLADPNPLAGLQSLARAWLSELRAAGARVVAITGSTGKTSTKDILAALLAAHLRTVASPANFNTEIGLPLAILAAPAGTEALVLEMAMRGPGQIAELTAIAEPEVGVIVNVGPVHLRAARLAGGDRRGQGRADRRARLRRHRDRARGRSRCWRSTCVTTSIRSHSAPAAMSSSPSTVPTGASGSWTARPPADRRSHDLRSAGPAARRRATAIAQKRPPPIPPASSCGRRSRRRTTSATCSRPSRPPARSALRPAARLLCGSRRCAASASDCLTEIVLIDDCYNANPMSMRSALDDLAETATGRRVAVLGDMLELGSEERRFHREIGAHAAARGVDVLVTVGPLAAEMATAFAGEDAHSVADAPAAAELLAAAARSGATRCS